MEEAYKRKDIQNFYQDSKKVRQTNKQRTTYCTDEDGLLLGKTKQKLTRWAQYFEKLLNEDEEKGEMLTQEVADEPRKVNVGSITNEDIDNLLEDLEAEEDDVFLTTLNSWCFSS
ncbi:hypothetical protein QE152_g29175 [Popillia japonica]|uniref:Uncharacterized protein n=1 Tax=Popillia japonica TaxID=7064 RepID=A0AAW1JK03_POPJA